MQVECPHCNEFKGEEKMFENSKWIWPKSEKKNKIAAPATEETETTETLEVPHRNFSGFSF